MQIIDFTKEWLPKAQALAQKNYDEARALLPTLPEASIPPLDHFAENGMGAAAVVVVTSLINLLSGKEGQILD